MKNLGKASLLLAFIVFLAGCQPVDTFNPLYTDKDVTFDPALLGKWALDEVTLEFSDAGNKTYNVVFSDATDPQRMILEGHLLVLEGHRFLDLVQKSWVADPASFPLSIEQAKNGFKATPHLIRAGDGAYLEFMPGGSGKATQMNVHLRVAHWFFRLTNDDKNLQVAFVDDDRLTKTLQAKSVEVAHVLIKPDTDEGSQDPHLALTATTAELQKFVLDHVNDGQIFADTLKYHRP